MAGAAGALPRSMLAEAELALEVAGMLGPPPPASSLPPATACSSWMAARASSAANMATGAEIAPPPDFSSMLSGEMLE